MQACHVCVLHNRYCYPPTVLLLSKYILMIRHPVVLVQWPPHPVSQWQGLGLQDWPEARGENTSTLHLARSRESFQCSCWAPQVLSQCQGIFGCMTRKQDSHRGTILCEEPTLIWAAHGHDDCSPLCLCPVFTQTS